MNHYLGKGAKIFREPTGLLGVILVITVFLLLSLILYEFNSLRNFRHLFYDNITLNQYRSVVQDKVAASEMATRMAVVTNDAVWRKRYLDNHRELLAAIKVADRPGDDVDLSIDALNKIEAEAFALLAQGRVAEAKEIIFGATYETLQKNYEDTLYRYDITLQKEIATDLHQRIVATYYLSTSILCILVLLIIGWVVTTYNIVRLKKIKEKERLEELLYYGQVKQMHESSVAVKVRSAFFTLQENREEFLKEVKRALDQDQFVVHYQPIVSVETGKIFEFEALVRWEHPAHGLLVPALFLPLIENTDLIIQLGEKVLRAACQQLKKWHEMGYQKLSVAVNLSAHQFKDPGLFELIDGVLKSTEIPPVCLILEITETMILQDIEQNKKLLQRLGELGVRFSLDDFGTGYSSLSYIKQFPISIIKIDRSFVSDMTTDITSIAIIESIISLGKTLGLALIAEGVEKEAELQALKKMKCDMFQGYFFSRPIPAQETIQLLEKQPSKQVDLLDDSSRYQYKVLQQEHREQAVQVITQSFCEHEPMTQYLGITSREFTPFAELMVDKAIKDGLSIAALEGDKLMACTVVEDVANPLDITIDIDPRFKIIFSLLEQLGGDFFHGKKINPGHMAHLFITAVSRDYTGKGLSRKINFESIQLARQKKYDFMCCEFTNEYNEKGTVKNLRNSKLLIRSYRYQDYVYEGKKPFPTLEGGASAYVWELRKGAKLAFSVD